MTTKEKVLKSALKLFATQGIEKTSTAEISKDAGIAAGTLFVHFKTKQELIDTIYIEIKKNAMSGLTDIIDPERTDEENIKEIVRKVANHLLQSYDDLLFMEAMERDPQFSSAAHSEAGKYYLPIYRVIKKWTNEGRFKKIDADTINFVIWSMTVTITKVCKLKKLKKVKEKHLDLVWDAIKPNN